MNETLQKLSTLQESLKAQAKQSNSKKSVEIIFDVCTEVSKGSLDFSYSNIGDLSSSRSGPTAQAIRNKNGERYRILIDAFAREFPAKNNFSTRDKEADWIDKIEDHHTRYLVKELEHEKKTLFNENNIFRTEIARGKCAPIISLDADVPLTEPGKSHQMQILPTLTDHDFRIIHELEDSLSPERLEKKGLFIGNQGEVRDSLGDLILPRGTIELINKLLSLKNSQP
jgi:hypothetical protein